MKIVGRLWDERKPDLIFCVVPDNEIHERQRDDEPEVRAGQHGRSGRGGVGSVTSAILY